MQPTSRLFQNYCDAEHDIGLRPEDSSDSVCEKNTERLQAALDGVNLPGQFRYFNGRTGPVLYEIQFSGKEYFFAGTMSTANLIGSCVLTGEGGRTYPMISPYYTNANQGGCATRLTRVDGETGGAFFRVHGHGATFNRIQFNGRPYLTDSTGEGPQTGTKTESCFEIQGRSTPASGGHVFRECLINQFQYGINCVAGYYDSTGTWVGDENHADNGLVDGVMFHGCDSCFRSTNLQAVCWNFRNIRAGSPGGAGQVEMIVMDIVRGGNCWIDGLDITSRRVTLFKVSANAANDYSHLTSHLTCRNFKWDHYAASASNYLTLFNLSGVDPAYNGGDMSFHQWTVRCEGHIGDSAGSPGYDDSRLIVLNDIEGSVGVTRTDLLFDVRNLPTTGFTLLGSGPWYYPDASWRV